MRSSKPMILSAVVASMLALPVWGARTRPTPAPNVTLSGEAVAVAQPVPTKKGRTPAALARIQDRAEDILAQVPRQAWSKVAGDLGAIRTSWRALEPQATEDGVPEQLRDEMVLAISHLGDNVRAHEREGTLRTANNLAAAALDVVAVYEPTLPADVSRLTIFERQLAIDAEDGNAVAATETLAALSADWGRVEPLVETHGGAHQAAAMDTLLDEQRTAAAAQNFAALRHAAERGRERSQLLIRLF